MSSPKIGSLFSGVGGLDMGVQQVLGGDVVWHVEFDEAPSKVLAHHWPDVPNYGDITQVDWAAVEPIDILIGGFPCQDVSLAGARAGIKDGTRSGLWAHYAHAIEQLKPKMVIIENVRGLLSAEAVGSMESDPWGMGNGQPRSVINALGAVLGDLARLGFDARWGGVRAADAGAPHGRFRVFIVATDTQHDGDVAGAFRGSVGTFPAPGGHERVAEGSGVEPAGTGGDRTRATVTPDPNSGECDGWERDTIGSTVERTAVAGSGDVVATDWGVYEPAIRRWEQVLGRAAPSPTNPDGTDGEHRLAPQFTEWMMGLPEGHVTDPAIGLGRNPQLKALGNGVVPAQCALALRMLGVNSWQ